MQKVAKAAYRDKGHRCRELIHCNLSWHWVYHTLCYPCFAGTDAYPACINVLLHVNVFTLTLPIKFFHLHSALQLQTSQPFVYTTAGGKGHSGGATENPGICMGWAILNIGLSESLKTAEMP